MGINSKDLREVRQKFNLTQKEMGYYLGVTSSTISKYEHAKIIIPLHKQKLICNIDSSKVSVFCSHLKTNLICAIDNIKCIDRDCHFKARIKRNKGRL